MSGGGIGGSRDAARIIDACLIILTNTTGRPMFGNSVVGSYGLYVNKQGMLQSPANASAPTRQVNSLIAPGGYVGTWLRNNGAIDTLLALYRSAYPAPTVKCPTASRRRTSTERIGSYSDRGTRSVLNP